MCFHVTCRVTISCVTWLSDRFSKHLLADEDLTFDIAMKIAQAMELVEQDARDLQQAGAHNMVPVHKLSQPPGASKLGRAGNPCHWWEGVVTPLSAASEMQSVMMWEEGPCQEGMLKQAHIVPIQDPTRRPLLLDHVSGDQCGAWALVPQS